MNFSIFKSALFIMILAMAPVFTACDNDKNNDPQPVNPQAEIITITSPSENSSVMTGHNLMITGKIEAAKQLHGYTITIRRKSDNTEVFKKEAHDHATSITINQPWTADGFTHHTDLELEIVATLDHDGNTATKKVNFHCMPQ